MSDEALITLGVAEFENLMETQGLENTVKGVLAIANDELDQEAIGGGKLKRRFSPDFGQTRPLQKSGSGRQKY